MLVEGDVAPHPSLSGLKARVAHACPSSPYSRELHCSPPERKEKKKRASQWLWKNIDIFWLAGSSLNIRASLCGLNFSIK